MSRFPRRVGHVSAPKEARVSSNQTDCNAFKFNKWNLYTWECAGLHINTPSISLNTDSTVHSVFNYSQSCNYVMFTICEPSLLAPHDTLCTMSTAAANYTTLHRPAHRRTPSMYSGQTQAKHGTFTSCPSRLLHSFHCWYPWFQLLERCRGDVGTAVRMSSNTVKGVSIQSTGPFPLFTLTKGGGAWFCYHHLVLLCFVLLWRDSANHCTTMSHPVQFLRVV